MPPNKTQPTTCHYFVDEAGDGTLFDKKGRIIVGNEGCSRFFLLGLVHIDDAETMSRDLEELRRALLADPYFRHIPSMQPECRKTAVFFHAKDDIPEVRREVFSLLLRHDFEFLAIVRDKNRIAQDVRTRNARDPVYRYHPNELYDSMVGRLFGGRLHKHEAYTVTFAKRGNSDRTSALEKALDTARQRFNRKWGLTVNPKIGVIPTSPKANQGLQVVDYCLWALQRLYEKREDRFVEYLWPKFHLVLDVDDRRVKKYGEYYTQKNPLTLRNIEELPEI